MGLQQPNVQAFNSVLPDGRPFNTSVYTFVEVGDELPMHIHTHWHNVMVLRGSALIFDKTGKELILKAGELAGVKGGRWHGVRALEPDTLTVHVSEPAGVASIKLEA